jgi:iron complex outermembrane recepter protein
MKFILPFILVLTLNSYSQDSLSIKSKTTKEVTIIAQKPQIKVEAGKTTLETTNATIQQGTLKTLMEQMPGVMFDNNNNVSVKGKTGLRILVDGKTSQLAISDMKSFIESIPATSIKSIEVLTNPGAQYDAEGKSGIINIKLKKDKREGFNTKLSAGVGTVFNKFSGGIFSNYKNDQFNIFGNYQYNYNDQWFGYSESRKSSFEGKDQYYDYIASWKDFKNTHNLKSGIDLFLAKNTTLGYTIDYNVNDGHGNNYLDNTSEQYNPSRALSTKFYATNQGTNLVKTLSNGLSFKQTFDSSKAEWTVDMSHTYFLENQVNVNENFAYDAAGIAKVNEYYYFEPQLNNNVHNLMVKTDVSLPIKFAKIDLGLKNESNFNQNVYRAYLKDYGTARYTSDKYSNDFNYNDNVLATYLTASKTLGFFQIDAGARLENTIISSNNPSVSRQYLNLFPNLGIAFPLDSYTSVTARYSRRIDRPSFNKLNNRVVYYNRYTANIGVPTLQPEMSDIISAQVERSFMQGALNISLGAEYNMETNDIDEFSYIDSSYVSYFTAANIGTANLFSTTLNIYFRPSKYFDINLTPQLLITEYKTTYNNIYYESKGTTTQLSGQTNFYLPNGFKLSLNGFMTPKMIWTQGYSEFLGMLNGSISKSFLKDKLNVVFSCSDIFNSNTWIGYQNTGNVASRGVWKPETRIAWLNLTYSFGKKINYQRKEIQKSDRIQSTGR